MFGARKALKLVPLNPVAFRAEIPKVKCRDVMLTVSPSNSIFWASLSTAFRALRESKHKN